MRVTSSFWVGAFIRRCFSEGAPAVVERKGADEAGAIFVVVDRLNGTADLYGQAPQSAFEDGRPADRLFQKLMTSQPGEAVGQRIGNEVRFDPDLWVVTIEDRDGRVSLDTVGP